MTDWTVEWNLSNIEHIYRWESLNGIYSNVESWRIISRSSRATRYRFPDLNWSSFGCCTIFIRFFEQFPLSFFYFYYSFETGFVQAELRKLVTSLAIFLVSVIRYKRSFPGSIFFCKFIFWEWWWLQVDVPYFPQYSLLDLLKKVLISCFLEQFCLSKFADFL